MRWLFATGLLLFSIGCDGQGPAAGPAGDVSSTEPQLRVLLVGNSLTASHAMPDMLAQLLRHDGSPDSVFVDYRAPGNAFLVTHLEVHATPHAIRQGNWDFVVLQGQKYSTSGRYTYPHDAAVQLCQIARESGAAPILFAEWGRRDHPGEGAHIHALYQLIAEKTAAAICPVGLAWDHALRQRPDLVLYAEDGNHPSPVGSFLTACTLYATITGRDPRQATPPQIAGLAADDRAFLQQVTWEIALDQRATNGRRPKQR